MSTYEVDVVRVDAAGIAAELKTIRIEEANTTWSAMNAAIRKAKSEGGAWKIATMVVATNVKLLEAEK